MPRRVRGTACQLLIALLSGLCLAARAAQPFDYTPADEIAPGPESFTGEHGEFVIYRR